MKRDPALTSLSRDHHQALFVAQQLRRVADETVEPARAAFLAYREEHGRAHFEERELFPMIGQAMPAEALAALAGALEHPGGGSPDG